jgi:hypothetical protein
MVLLKHGRHLSIAGRGISRIASQMLAKLQYSSSPGYSPSNLRHLSSCHSIVYRSRDLPSWGRSPSDCTLHCPCPNPPAPHSFWLRMSQQALSSELAASLLRTAARSRSRRCSQSLGIPAQNWVLQGHFCRMVSEENTFKMYVSLVVMLYSLLGWYRRF